MSERDVTTVLDTAVMADPAATLRKIQAYLRAIGEADMAAETVNLLGLEGSAANYELVLSNFQYEDVNPLLSPTLVVERTFVNDSNAELTDTFTYSKTLQEAQVFTFTEGLKVGTKASAKFGLPWVGETSLEINAEVSFGATQSFATTTSQSWTQTSSVKVPPHTSLKVVGLVKVATNVNRGFTGDVSVSGGTFYFRVSSTTDPATQYRDAWDLIVPISAVLSESQLTFPVAGVWSGSIGTAVMITAKPADTTQVGGVATVG